MAQYIDKDALVAEIEKRAGFNKALNAYSRADECNAILSFIDTLEVKEVDLEEELQQHLKDCLNVKFPTTDVELIKKDVEYTARKFFELGVNVSNKAQKGE